MCRRSTSYTTLALLLQAAWGFAQTAPPIHPPRDYSATVTFHETPQDIKAPQRSKSPDLRVDYNVPAPISLSDEDYHLPLPDVPPGQVPSPALDPKNRKKKTDWLTDTSSKESDKDKTTPSGWGWLADDVRAAESKKQESGDNAADEDSKSSSATNGFASLDRDDSDNRNSRANPYTSALDLHVTDERSSWSTIDDKEAASKSDAAGRNNAAQDAPEQAWTLGSADVSSSVAMPLSRDANSHVESSRDFDTLGAAQPEEAQPDPGKQISIFDTSRMGANFAPALSSPADVSGSSGSSGFGMPSYGSPGDAAAGFAPNPSPAPSEPARSSLFESSQAAPEMKSNMDSPSLDSQQPKVLTW